MSGTGSSTCTWQPLTQLHPSVHATLLWVALGTCMCASSPLYSSHRSQGGPSSLSSILSSSEGS